MIGELYVVATPIGNLADMVPRAVETLQTVDYIAAEDTRHSKKLLDYFGISTPMLTYHDQSTEKQKSRLLQWLKEGKRIALISDAGTPLVSDPGFRLVREARKIGVRVTPIPGSCAAIAALSVAGLPSDRFCFEGFLPARREKRLSYLKQLAQETRTLIFYEAPHRILEVLEDLGQIFGEDREALFAREITKTYETFYATSLQALRRVVTEDANQRKGEIVIIVRGAENAVREQSDIEQRRVLSLLMMELPLKKAAALAADITGGNKKALYQLGVAIKEEG